MISRPGVDDASRQAIGRSGLIITNVLRGPRPSAHIRYCSAAAATATSAAATRLKLT